MPFLRNAARAYLLNRAARGSRRHRRSGSGFRMRGPFPTYSGRTRRGSRVTVGGCCLPIPFALTLAATVGAGRRLRRR